MFACAGGQFDFPRGIVHKIEAYTDTAGHKNEVYADATGRNHRDQEAWDSYPREGKADCEGTGGKVGMEEERSQLKVASNSDVRSWPMLRYLPIYAAYSISYRIERRPSTFLGLIRPLAALLTFYYDRRL